MQTYLLIVWTYLSISFTLFLFSLRNINLWIEKREKELKIRIKKQDKILNMLYKLYKNNK